MKLQIQSQHLRVRIDEDELAQLLAGETVVEVTLFGDAFAMMYRLRLMPWPHAALWGSSEWWTVALPEADVREHAARLPTREGLRFLLPTGTDSDPLELLFDVDVRDSVRRRRGQSED